MERTYHNELRHLVKQLTRIADLLEKAEERAQETAPIAKDVLELSLRGQRKLMEELR